MQTPETREIDGRAWTVSKFTGRESTKLFRTLLALAADPIGEALKGVADQLKPDDAFELTSILTISGGAIGLAGKMAGKLTDEEFLALAERLLKFTQCDGKPVPFDATFQGDPALLLRVLAFIVECNFVVPFVRWLGPAVGSALTILAEKMSASIPEPSSETKPIP